LSIAIPIAEHHLIPYDLAKERGGGISRYLTFSSMKRELAQMAL
jgi:hypothetical protein